MGLYWHVLPTYEQGRKIVWEGITGGGKRFLSAFPGFDRVGEKDSLVVRKRDDRMLLELANGSMFQVVGTDDTDRLVGSNPVGCVFSEYSLQNPAAWDLIRPILAENGGWAVFIYTMRGRNHGYRMLEMAKRHPDWFAENLTIDDTKKEDGTPVITREQVEAEIAAGMDPETARQEFWNDPDASLSGAYYKKQVRDAQREGRFTKVPWEPSVPVNTAWDLGMDDSTSIIFYQFVGREIHIIDYYENSGEGLAHYIKVLNEKPYAYDKHYAPHDLKVRELGTGRSRFEEARSLGITFQIVPKRSINEGIAAVRNVFPLLWIDQRNTSIIDKQGEDKGLIEAIRQYCAEWDPDRKVFRKTPRHDWCSHPCDALRQMALVCPTQLGSNSYRNKAPRQTHALSDYDVITNTIQDPRTMQQAHQQTYTREYDPFSY